MFSVSPLTAAFLLVLAVFFVGAIVAYLRDRSRFSGYQEIVPDVLRIARAIKGEITRDGGDLAITGGWRNLPVQVRLSHADNTPGLDIRMGAAAGFTLSVMPVQAQSHEVQGRVLVRTPDDMFDMRFAVRSDHPTQARLFIGSRQVMETLRTLCRSSQVFLLVSTGQIEFGDLGVPDAEAAATVLSRIETLGELAHELRSMPGADAIKVDRPRRRRAWVLRVALGAGLAALLVAVAMAARPAQTGARTAEANQFPEGVLPVDAEAITSAAEWRLARSADYDTAAVTWLRASGLQPEGRLEGNFCAGTARDTAYVMIGPGQMRRVVVLCEGEARYDSRYEYVGVAARIPRQLVSSIEWSTPPAETPEGDGLLITRKADDLTSGLVLFPQGRRILFGVPRNYQSIKLQ